jgi:hypothetical protein
VPGKKNLVIQPLGFEPPVEKAACELASYLPRLADVKVQVEPALPALPTESAADIVLGIPEYLAGLDLGALPKAHDMDDALAIIPKGGTLYLTGSNERSVLFAVYRLLEELGAVFVRPGPNGESLPYKRSLSLPKTPIREAASYRHRGVCIEGSPRLEHVLGILDWMAKKKMNAFQLQFRHSGEFWRRGYQRSPELGASARTERLSDEECYELDDRVIAKVKELGLMLHRVGHGWTAFVVNLPGFDWETYDLKPPKEKRDWLAQVKGRRDVWRNIPVNTELCYSKAAVRNALVHEVVMYAMRHPEVDLLHFWMSDAYNNKCECDGCRVMTPSDWYMMLVNDVGHRLQELSLPTRIVFLGYFDLLWPPERERTDVDNVTFMYAPISRCHAHPLADPKCDEDYDVSRPQRNRVRLPRGNRPNADIARQWLPLKLKDTFLFDYHLGSSANRDGLGQDIGDVMARDVRDLESLGFNGLMSCQNIRCFYPFPYLPNAMADMLWDKRQSIAAHRRKIMDAAFGKHAKAAGEYFAQMVKAFRVGPEYEHRTVSPGNKSQRARLKKIVALADAAHRRFSEARKKEKDKTARESLGLAALHAEHAGLIARAYLAALDGDKKAIAKMRAAYEGRFPKSLAEFAPLMDARVGYSVLHTLANAERAAETAAK